MSKLKRYTQLPQLLDILSTRTITVLSPASWQDRNDTYFLSRYAERKNLPGVLALCLTRASATYHHWYVFASSPSGVRLEFDERQFKEWAARIPNARLERVSYVKLGETGEGKLDADSLPFVKRHAFRDEGEVRLVVDAAYSHERARRLSFDLSLIRRIVVSPWLPNALFPAVEAAIRAAAPDVKLKIRQTTILENEEFKSAADNEA